MIMEERIPQVLFLIQLKRWIFCFLFFGKLVTLNFERFLFWSCVRYPLKVDPHHATRRLCVIPKKSLSTPVM